MCSSHQLLRSLGLLLMLLGFAHTQQPYDDFTWVKKFAAVGDSFTAAPGAGGLLDSKCSRYDGSYAVMMSRQFVALEEFYNLACTGAQSSDILAQIEQLPDGLDLAVMTAGGNDLCLATILVQCIFSNVASQAGCNSAIQLAQNGLATYLQSNIEQLINALAAKMNPNGIIVLLSYAQYFDATTSACTTEDWTLIGTTSLSLSTTLRATLNSLVVQTNAALQNAVLNAQQALTGTAQVVFANWDSWPAVVSGRFCEQGQNPNPFLGTGSTNMLQFFKQDTTRALDPYGELFLRRRNIDDGNQTTPPPKDDLFPWSDEPASYSPISPRGITPAPCPASFTWVPSSIGKLAHPTIPGHAAMMTFAMNAVRSLRAKMLGLAAPGCTAMQMTCGNPSSYVADSSYKPYATYSAVTDQVQDFCNMVQQAINKGQGPTPFAWNYVYYSGTPDQVQFSVKFDQSVSPGQFWSTSDCTSYLHDLLLQCWSKNSPASNPMQWSFGGSYVVGHWTYSVTPQTKTRLWPLPVTPRATVTGQINTKGVATYQITGSSWASWDYGQTTLLSNLTYCNGKAPINWVFEYQDASIYGYEWEAFMQTSNPSQLSCMTSGYVVYYAGGPSNTPVSWTSSVPSWNLPCLSASTGSLSCGADCCGYIPCGAWCNAYCGGITCG